MAIMRRLPWPELGLLVSVWLCLALEPNAAARLPGDHFVFPSESQPEIQSRLKDFDRQMAEVSRLTNVSLLMMDQEVNKGTSRSITASVRTGNETPSATTTGKGKGEIKKPSEEQVNLTAPRNQTHPSSESKVITFSSDPESNSQRPWDETEDPTTVKIKVDLMPRIALETTRICPEGYTLSNTHCRKNA
ncbi:hypothetical protein KR032_000713 [Drosophila birchii]|nr:hypothetical protein KR032_000713 [Drosophila birchii]